MVYPPWSDQLRDNLHKVVGLTLSIPIFNNHQAHSTYQRSIIEEKVAAVNLKESDNTLRQSIESAYNDAVTSSKSYQAVLLQLEAREEAFCAMEQRNKEGASNFFEYQYA